MNTNGAVYGNMLASDDDINITISRSTHADLEQETNSELIIILAGYKPISLTWYTKKWVYGHWPHKKLLATSYDDYIKLYSLNQLISRVDLLVILCVYLFERGSLRNFFSFSGRICPFFEIRCIVWISFSYYFRPLSGFSYNVGGAGKKWGT